MVARVPRRALGEPERHVMQRNAVINPGDLLESALGVATQVDDGPQADPFQQRGGEDAW